MAPWEHNQLENSIRHNKFRQQNWIILFYFWQKDLGIVSFLNLLVQNELEETCVQLRQGEIKQSILRLKQNVTAFPENPYKAWSIVEVTMIYISVHGHKSSPSGAVLLKLGTCQVIWRACYIHRHLDPLYRKLRDADGAFGFI